MNIRASTPDPLPRGVIHVWRLALDEIIRERQDLIEILTDEEQDRADRFVFMNDRHRFIAGRASMRAILSLYVSCAPEVLRIEYGAAGKPSLKQPASASSIQFNLSHSGGFGLLAVARQRVGVDLELMRSIPDARQIATAYFSASEQHELSRLSDNLLSEGFLNCWTRKEAFVKAIGDGLSLPLDSFDVSLTPNAPAALLQVRGGKEAAARWCIVNAPVGDGAVAALALEEPLEEMKCRDWSFQTSIGFAESL